MIGQYNIEVYRKKNKCYVKMVDIEREITQVELINLINEMLSIFVSEEDKEVKYISRIVSEELDKFIKKKVNRINISDIIHNRHLREDYYN